MSKPIHQRRTEKNELERILRLSCLLLERQIILSVEDLRLTDNLAVILLDTLGMRDYAAIR